MDGQAPLREEPAEGIVFCVLWTVYCELTAVHCIVYSVLCIVHRVHLHCATVLWLVYYAQRDNEGTAKRQQGDKQGTTRGPRRDNDS